MTMQTKTKPWSHLPNAAHIDRILADVRVTPEAWAAAREAAREAAWAAALEAAWDAAWESACSAALEAAWSAAWGAISALVAWDSADQYLDMPPDQVRMLAALGVPAAILMLPAAIAFNEIDVKNLTLTK